MTTTYTLRDRYVTEDGRLMIRATHDRTGAVVDIHVRPEDAEIAASLWGGADVPCTRAQDGTLWYWRHPDLMTEAESDALDRLLYLREARQIAGDGPTDAELLAVYEQPMSHRQRRAALEAMRQAPA